LAMLPSTDSSGVPMAKRRMPRFEGHIAVALTAVDASRPNSGEKIIN
jgi:hypothetical protein